MSDTSPPLRKRLDRLLGLLLGGLVLVASLAGGWLKMDYDSYLKTPLSVPAGGLDFVVVPGSNIRLLAADLAQRGVTDKPRYLAWYARWHGLAGKIQAGEYEITPGTTPVALLDRFVRGQVKQYRLTIIEGWTFRQMMAALEADPAVRHTLQGLSPAQVMARLDHPEQAAEGMFYPDTYRFPRGTTDLTILAKAYRTLQTRLAAEWQARAPGLPLHSPYEALILASIIEKETGAPQERAEIAGVFVRRLEKGMRLQTDPTVIYGMGDAFDGNLRAADLKRDTPYNSYTRAGLPPTPIALAGGASIHAALHPAPGDALYFVSRGDGTHQFSATLAEHDRAVRKYQLHRSGHRPAPRGH